MALSIVTEKRYSPQWNKNRDLPEGEQISCSYREMAVRDVLAIQKETGFNLLTGGSTEGDDAFVTNWTVMSAVLNKYTSDWRNIIKDGKTLSDAKDVLDTLSLRYLGLFGEIFQYILVASIGTDEDAKNFVPGSVQKDSESGTTVEAAPSESSETAEESI